MNFFGILILVTGFWVSFIVGAGMTFFALERLRLWPEGGLATLAAYIVLSVIGGFLSGYAFVWLAYA